ncbi:DUF4292 domain-containing protein [Ancylomarina longa]|uniref:DUF4292 domain-containing protein n=1 Tax=Ancylomarina longa TaxID=2487017 RepID=A0A434AWF3_9BACT|nr:DUF4292 domain-containing protein [Ancylomarina longa]RUT78835.1 DUF4292 domain-containing protein [Ancylomarina longa]
MKSRIVFKYLFRALVLTLALFQSSCKTIHELGLVSAKPISDNKLYHLLIDSSLHYKSFYVKRFSASYSMDGIKKKFKGSIKIQKDSIIWISITAPVGGIEVVRLLVTPDSIKMINRLKKNYIVDDFDFFLEKANIDLNFKALESILTNSLFKSVNEEKDKAFIRSFNGKIFDDKYVFVSEKARKIGRKLKKDKYRKLHRFNYQRFDIDPALMRITDIEVRDFEDARNTKIQYRNFINFESNKFPQRLSFEVQDAKHLLSCDIKFNKVILNEDLRFSFKISNKYKRINP